MSDWEERAGELHEFGGVPPKRAKVVALLEGGDRTHADVADVLGCARTEVSVHVKRYRERDVPQARWLDANAPAI